MNWLGVFRADLADVFVRCEPLEGLETLGKVVGGHEVREMSSKLVMGLVVEALCGCVLDDAVHPLDLPIGPEGLGLGQAMIDIAASTRDFEGMGPERLMPPEHALDIGDRLTLAFGVGEVGPVVSQHGMDRVRDRFDEA